MSLIINMEPGGPKQVTFDFNYSRDTARGVAEEMAAELKLSEGYVNVITNLIEKTSKKYLHETAGGKTLVVAPSKAPQPPRVSQESGQVQGGGGIQK